MHTMHFDCARNECGNLFTSAQSTLEVPWQRWSRARRRERGAWISVLGDPGGVRKREKLLQMSASVTGRTVRCCRGCGEFRSPAEFFWQLFLRPHLAANNRAASLVHTATGTITSTAKRACVPRREPCSHSCKTSVMRCALCSRAPDL